MHAGMETAQRLVNESNYSLLKIQDSFSQALVKEQLLEIENKRLDKKGRDTLENIFEKLDYKLPINSQAEQKFDGIRLGQARLRGTLDRIDKIGNKVAIIDYKTGKPLTSLFTKNKTEEIKAYKHKLQLIFYAILAKEAMGAKIGNIEGQMIYLQADSQKLLTKSYAPTKEDVDYLSRLIEAVWKRIINLDLPDVTKYPETLEGIKQFEADLL
jgi:hypothetical protein